jgi:hypothetical protein
MVKTCLSAMFVGLVQESGIVRRERIVLGVLLGGMVTSGTALADCPSDMPTQLLEDCIVYEGAGTSFPSSDYAHMDLYQEWLKTRASSLEAKRSTPE